MTQSLQRTQLQKGGEYTKRKSNNIPWGQFVFGRVKIYCASPASYSLLQIRMRH
ncbi:MAG: hypothetical protein WB474_10120 [Nitrososphaeraceae archaeon]